jgi:hypothetical protein
MELLQRGLDYWKFWVAIARRRVLADLVAERLSSKPLSAVVTTLIFLDQIADADRNHLQPRLPPKPEVERTGESWPGTSNSNAD